MYPFSDTIIPVPNPNLVLPSCKKIEFPFSCNLDIPTTALDISSNTSATSLLSFVSSSTVFDVLLA